MPKTVQESKFQEWEGLDRIVPVVHQMKCIFRELTKDDFGVDGEIEIVVPKPDGKGWQTTGGIIKVQSKSGKSYIKEDKETSFSSPVSKDDLEDWYKATYPTIYIVFHPDDNKLYWKEIRSFVKNTPNVWQRPWKITFDKANDEFTTQSYETLKGLAINESPPRISIREKEQLFSNLLRINKLPLLWSASTQHRTRQNICDAIEGSVPPFTVFNSRIYSLANLHDRNSVLKPFITVSTVRSESVHEWCENENQCREYQFLLNQLLGKHLRKCKLRYSKEFKRNYFLRENDTSLEFKRRWWNIRTDRDLVTGRLSAKFYQYGKDKFWRHTAVNLTFRKIGSSWFLQVIPKYFFTEDGFKPCESSKIGSWTTQIKAKETNPHVLNQVLFWADVLSGTDARSHKDKVIKFWLDGVRMPVLEIEKMPVTGIANFSIPFDPAVYEEPELSGQMGMFETFFGGSEDTENDAMDEGDAGEDDDY